jgi:uncharacterized protein YhaN
MLLRSAVRLSHCAPQLKEQLAALQAAKDALEKEKAGLEGDKAGLTQQLGDTRDQLGAQGKKLEQTEVGYMVMTVHLIGTTTSNRNHQMYHTSVVGNPQDCDLLHLWRWHAG